MKLTCCCGASIECDDDVAYSTSQQFRQDHQPCIDKWCAGIEVFECFTKDVRHGVGLTVEAAVREAQAKRLDPNYIIDEIITQRTKFDMRNVAPGYVILGHAEVEALDRHLKDAISAPGSDGAMIDGMPIVCDVQTESRICVVPKDPRCRPNVVQPTAAKQDDDCPRCHHWLTNGKCPNCDGMVMPDKIRVTQSTTKGSRNS